MFEIVMMARHGLGAAEWLYMALVWTVGLFFALSGYNKLFDAERHATLVATLKHCGIPFVRFNQWFVPGVEFLGGLGLLVGLFTVPIAVALAFLLLVAMCTDGPEKVCHMKPINLADQIDCWLYMPEATYFMILLFIAANGPTMLAWDHAFWEAVLWAVR